MGAAHDQVWVSARPAEVCGSTCGHDHRLEVAVNLNNLAAIHYRRGDLAEAEVIYRRALAIKEKVLGDRHPELAATLNNLGLVRKARGDYDDASSLFARAIATLDQLVAADHPTLTICRENQADLRGGSQHPDTDDTSGGK